MKITDADGYMYQYQECDKYIFHWLFDHSHRLTMSMIAGFVNRAPKSIPPRLGKPENVIVRKKVTLKYLPGFDKRCLLGFCLKAGPPSSLCGR